MRWFNLLYKCIYEMHDIIEQKKSSDAKWRCSVYPFFFLDMQIFDNVGV